MGLKPTPFAEIPRLWPESTIACLATGPSLTAADCDYVRGKVDAVIAINNAIYAPYAPWADVWYCCDAKPFYWDQQRHHGAAMATPARKYTMAVVVPSKFRTVELVKNTGDTGLETRPFGLRTGKNSGYQAINLAYHFGAKRIVLLGFDMKGDHCFGSHPDHSKPPFTTCIPKFRTLVEPLRAAGVEVINCSRRTAVDAFPVQALEVVLPSSDAQVA